MGVLARWTGAVWEEVTAIAAAHHAAHEPSGSDAMAVDAAAATGSLRTLGTGATQAAVGNHAHAGTVTANRQTASYALVLADADKVVEMNVAGANTLTLPPSVFSAGQCGEGVQWGAGQTTITPGAGVTIRSSGGKLKTTAQYSSFSWRCVASNEFHVAGELAT